MEIAALILGIVGLVGSFIPFVQYIALACSLVAVILGAIGVKKNTPNKGKAKAGLILGIISLAIGITLIIACSVCAAAAF